MGGRARMGGLSHASRRGMLKTCQSANLLVFLCGTSAATHGDSELPCGAIKCGQEKGLWLATAQNEPKTSRSWLALQRCL